MATMSCENPHDSERDQLDEAPPRCKGCGHKVEYPGWTCPDCGLLCEDCAVRYPALSSRRFCKRCGLRLKRERDEEYEATKKGKVKP